MSRTGFLRCSKMLPDGGRSVSFHSCSLRASVQANGEWYCKRHDPVVEKAKRTLWEQQYQAKEQRQAAARREAQKLIKQLGAGAEHYDWHGRDKDLHGYTEHVVLTFAEARELIERLGGR